MAPCPRGAATTFLAGLDLTELPVHEGLPKAGWLLFFADLDNDEAEGLIDEAANAPGEATRLFYVAAGVDPIEVEPPAALNDVLETRRVEAVAQLALPDDDVGERLSLDAAESEAYEEIARLLRRPGVVIGRRRPLGPWSLDRGAGSPHGRRHSPPPAPGLGRRLRVPRWRCDPIPHSPWRSRRSTGAP